MLRVGGRRPPRQSTLERVRANGRLRVGIDATYPPFGIAEGGEFSGFDVDIARAIARRARASSAELINASFDGVFPALQNGTFDVVISAVTITPERRGDDAVLGSLHRGRPADRRARRQPDRRARRSRRAHGRRADQHDGAVRDGEAPGRDASRSTTRSTSRCWICRTGASTRWRATDRCCAT